MYTYTDPWEEMARVELSSFMLVQLHEHATAACSQWNFSDHSTIEIPVTKRNAETIYGICREIREGLNHGVSRKMMEVIKAARMEAHQYLYEEANDPNTSIDRKIILVKLTSKNRQA